MKKVIKDWKQLAKLKPSKNYRLIIGDCCGWIVPINDEPYPHRGNSDEFQCNCKIDSEEYINFFDHHIYLSTHTFYKNHYKESTKLLNKYGWKNIEIDNWDKEEEGWKKIN